LVGFRSELYVAKKEKYNVSKIPDIYDAAKYDALHNSHMQLTSLEELYTVAKRLADGVIEKQQEFRV
jgi:inositol hexakisphosphate/diphosphoinositol-pentakisphosphate kinase